MTRFWMLFAALLLAATTSVQAAPRHRHVGTSIPHYLIKALPLAEAGGLNDRGQVVGIRYVGDPLNESGDTPCRAFLWSRGRRLIPLGKIGKQRECTPSAVSSVGEVAGAVATDEQGEFASHYADAFAWRAGRMRQLPGLDGYGSNRAADVNRSGMIVGSASTAFVSRIENDQQPDHAVSWEHGKVTDLGDGEALAVNNRGQIVGESIEQGFDTRDGRVTFDARAALWENGKVRLLEPAQSVATAINRKGQVVGMVGVGNVDRSFLYTSGSCRDIGVGRAVGINDRGQVIIIIDDRSDIPPGLFLWQDGRRYDLRRLIRNPSGWTDFSVTRINNAGVILGNGSYRGRQHAFLLTPQ